MGKRSNVVFDHNLKSERRLAKVEDVIARRQERKNFSKAKHLSGKSFCAKAVFECQLFLGDSKFPRTKSMTIFERSSANKLFEDKFSKSFDVNGDTTKRLSQWRFKDGRSVHNAMNEYILAKIEKVDLLLSGGFLERYNCSLKLPVHSPVT